MAGGTPAFGELATDEGIARQGLYVGEPWGKSDTQPNEETQGQRRLLG